LDETKKIRGPEKALAHWGVDDAGEAMMMEARSWTDSTRKEDRDA
jgi:hypothetical protein